MKYIELFAGIGGFRSALDKQGHECVFASEIDKYATLAYKTLYGGDELHGDITKIHAEDIPDHDLLVGGFPCQAFSIAGQRKGFDDTRGTLFYEIVRIADYKRPKWLMLENVKGLLSHDGGRTFEIMCVTLNDIGYAIDFAVLNSKHYGVPQNRERIFIVANRDARHEDWQIDGSDVVAKAKKRIAKLGVKTFNFDYPKNDTVDKRLRDVLQENVDEKFYLSAEKTAKLIHQLREKDKAEVVAVKGDLIDRDEPRGQYGFSEESMFTIRCAQVHGAAVKEPQVNVIGSLEYYNFDCMNRVHDADGLSPTIQTLQGGSREPKIAIEVRPVLTPDRMEKRQNGRRFKDNDEEAFTLTAQDIHGIAIKEATKIGYDVAYEFDSVNIVHPDSETRRGRVGKQIANTLETNCNQGVVESQELIETRKLGRLSIGKKVDLSHTICARDYKGLSTYEQTGVLENGYRIRKLTPLECFRLQGFTDEQFNRLKEAGISDSQLYKMAGNAVTVNVIEELGKKMIAWKDGLNYIGLF